MRTPLQNWHFVRAGLWLKLVAVGVLLLGGLTATVGVLDAKPFELLLAVVGVATGLDGVGRVLCLTIPRPGAARLWVRISVALQLTGAAALGVAVVLWNLDLLPEEAVFALGATAPLFQLGAAVTFLMFLGELAKLGGRPDVANRATRVIGWVVVAWTGGGALGVALAAAAVVTGALFVVTLMAGGIGGFVAAFVFALVLLPFLLIELGILLTMYLGYGRVLYQLGRTRFGSVLPSAAPV